jgi:hypothetical protein
MARHGPAGRLADENHEDRWVTGSSAHFVIYALGGASLARRVLADAERALQALRVALAINMPLRDGAWPLTLILFGYEWVYPKFASDDSRGQFRAGWDFGQTDLVRSLAKGAPVERAWAQAFPASVIPALEQDYLASRSRSSCVFHRFPCRPAPALIWPVRTLDDAEAHVLHARLYGRWNREAARRELDHAIARDPRNAEAFALRSIEGRDAAQRWSDAERAVALDADLLLGWVALGLSLSTNKARQREAVQRLESFEGSAEAFRVAAMVRDTLGDAPDALAAARTAVRLAPWHFFGHAIHARVAARAQRTSESAAARAKACAVAPASMDREWIEKLSEL